MSIQMPARLSAYTRSFFYDVQAENLDTMSRNKTPQLGFEESLVRELADEKLAQKSQTAHGSRSLV